MRFGIFYEHQLPRPWAAESEYRLLHEALDQVELADRLGYDYAWEVEHHFMEEYSHSSAPEVFLAAASQRTERIRLGHGIVQLTTNHPARVAERVSTLDLLSHGRVELGLGEGSSVTELHPFDRRFREKRSVWEDAVRCLMPMFADGGSEYHGEWFDFPLPVGGRRPGLGARLLQRLHEALRPAGRLHGEPGGRCGQPVHVRADRRGGAGDGGGLVVLPVRPRLYPGSVDLWQEFLEFKETPKGQAARLGGLVGSPDTIRARLGKFEQSNVDQVILLNQAGRNANADICASLELFAAEVMDEFHEREPQYQAWKQAVLDGDIELEELDTEPFNVRSYQSVTKEPSPT